MNKKKGILIVVSGFSGAGKGTIMNQLMKEYPDTYALSISATTRSPRPGEVHGKEYFFLSEKEFEDMIESGALLEYAQYVDHYYGTPKSYVQQQLEAGKDVILEIEIQGALKVKKANPDALLLFVTPPSAKELKRRLAGRGTEEEAQGVEDYDYLVVNGDLEEAVQKVHTMIQNEHDRVARNHTLIETIKAELQCFAKGE